MDGAWPMESPMRAPHRPWDNPMRVDPTAHSPDDDVINSKEEDPAKPSYTT